MILPWSVALRITLRGMKIRLGRALITLAGIVLGIAFLMSVLTGESLRRGLAVENRIRTEVARLVKLVEDDVRTFKDKKFAVLVSGPVTDPHHLRLLAALAERAGPGNVWVLVTEPDRLGAAGKAPLQPELGGPGVTRAADAPTPFRDAHAALFLHDQLPSLSDADLTGLLARMAQPVILDVRSGRYREADLRKLNPAAAYGTLSCDLSPEETARLAKRAAQARARTLWITVISMLVTIIGIANAMLMSVTERIREIGTMKCLGALAGFVVKLFLIETGILGVLGGLIGTLLGFAVPFLAYLLSTGAKLLIESTPFVELLLLGAASTLAGTVFAMVAAIYPARVAAKMVPADALRTNV